MTSIEEIFDQVILEPVLDFLRVRDAAIERRHRETLEERARLRDMLHERLSLLIGGAPR